MNQEKRIRITGVKHGIILGLVLLMISIGAFYFIISATKSPLLFILIPVVFSYLLPVILVILFCVSFRRRIGGYWSFRQATTGIFIMFLTAYALQTIGHDIIFAKLIEPEMTAKTYAATVEAAGEMKKQPKVDTKRIDDNLNEIKKNIDAQKNITVLQVISGLAINIIMVFVFALIFGVLFKKDVPVYQNIELDGEIS